MNSPSTTPAAPDLIFPFAGARIAPVTFLVTFEEEESLPLQDEELTGEINSCSAILPDLAPHFAQPSWPEAQRIWRRR